MPSTPSQKSIDVCRSAPVRVMWCTPWLWSFLTSPSTLDESRLVLASLQASPRHEVHASLNHEYVAEPVADRLGERVVGDGVASELDTDG